MPGPKKQLEWSIFWIREVLVLAVPSLFAVFTLERGAYLELQRATALLGALVCLTCLNVYWMFFRNSKSG